MVFLPQENSPSGGLISTSHLTAHRLERLPDKRFLPYCNGSLTTRGGPPPAIHRILSSHGICPTLMLWTQDVFLQINLNQFLKTQMMTTLTTAMLLFLIRTLHQRSCGHIRDIIFRVSPKTQKELLLLFLPALLSLVPCLP